MFASKLFMGVIPLLAFVKSSRADLLYFNLAAGQLGFITPEALKGNHHSDQHYVAMATRRTAAISQ